MDRLIEQVEAMVEIRYAQKGLTKISERKTTLGRSRSKCEENIKMEYTNIIWLRTEHLRALVHNILCVRTRLHKSCASGRPAD